MDSTTSSKIRIRRFPIDAGEDLVDNHECNASGSCSGSILYRKADSALDGKSRRTFPEILNEIVGRLREEDFKLTRIAKSYRREGLNLLRWLLEEKRRIGSVEVV